MSDLLLGKLGFRLPTQNVGEPKKTRWIWLKNTSNFKPKHLKQLDALKDRNLKTAFAYQLRLTFQEVFTLTDRHQGATLLKGWIDLTKESASPPLVKVAYTTSASRRTAVHS